MHIGLSFFKKLVDSRATPRKSLGDPLGRDPEVEKHCMSSPFLLVGNSYIRLSLNIFYKTVVGCSVQWPYSLVWVSLCSGCPTGRIQRNGTQMYYPRPSPRVQYTQVHLGTPSVWLYTAALSCLVNHASHRPSRTKDKASLPPLW